MTHPAFTPGAPLWQHMLAWRWFEYYAVWHRTRRERRWLMWDRAFGDACASSAELARRDWS